MGNYGLILKLRAQFANFDVAPQSQLSVQSSLDTIVKIRYHYTGNQVSITSNRYIISEFIHVFASSGIDVTEGVKMRVSPARVPLIT